jgi:hypothetical protein
MRYRVHRFDLKMTRDQGRLEQYLNGLEGEVVGIVPNVTMTFMWVHQVDFVLVVEKLP